MANQVSILALKENPVNSKIYFTNEQDDAELQRLIEQYGIQRPIVCNQDNVIVSGHRRFKAACALGMSMVPVETRRFATRDEEEEFLILDNAYREKTMEERIREGKRLKDIVERRGEKTRDVVGKAIGISGRTFDKGAKVVDEIDAIKESDPERAAMLRDKLTKSVDGAYREIQTNETETVESEQTPLATKEEIEAAAEEKRLYFWRGDLEKLTSFMAAIYIRLSKERNGTTPKSVGAMIGNIEEMRERLMSWAPKRMRDCPVCGGTSQVKAPDGKGGEAVVRCDVCINGKVGLYKESKK